MKLTTSARLAASMLGGAALLALAGLPAMAQDAPKPVAVVNGQPITADDLAVSESDISATISPQLSAAQKQEYLTSYTIDLNLAAAEAAKAKVLSEEEIARRLAYFRKKIEMEAFLTKVAKDASNDEAAKKFYDDTVKTIKPEEEAHARHILLPDEDTAKKAYERVKGGEDFAKVAKELSKDPGSSDGGDLGWFTRERMVKEFADAAFALKPGEISQPVKSQFGWHVIKLEDRRNKPIPAFEQVKPQITRFLGQKAQQDLIMRLRTEAKIEKTEPPKAEEAPKTDAAPAAPAADPAKPADPAPAPAPAHAP